MRVAGMKRYAQQLLLVLWKNLLLRWRNPVLFGLELAWPILIFALLGLIRQATLPVGSETCHFAPIGLPSAGLLPLVQSMLCGLGSTCLNASQAAATLSAPINRYERRLRPLRDDPGAPRALRHIPDTLSLFSRFHEGLGDPAIGGLLQGSVSLSEFLDDPDALRTALGPLLSPPSVDALLGSHLNVSKVLTMRSGESFRSVVCDPARLGAYLVADGPSPVSLASLSSDLCQLSGPQKEELLNSVQGHLSSGKVARTLAGLAGLVGDERTAAALRDVGGLMESWRRLEKADNFSAALPSLLRLSDSLPDLWSFFAETEGRRLDLGFLEEVVGDVQGVLGQGGQRKEWDSFRAMLHYGDRLSNWFKYNLYAGAESASARLGDVFGGGERLSRALRDAPVQLSPVELSSLDATELPSAQLDSFYSVRSGDDLRRLLCQEGPLGMALELRHQLCGVPVWSQLFASLNLTWLHSREVEASQAAKYRGLEFARVAEEARALSRELKAQLARPDSLLSRSLDFAKSVRFDPIYQSAKLASQRRDKGPDGAPVDMGDVDSVFQEASTTVWGLLRSLLGRGSSQWRGIQMQACNAEQISVFLLSLLPKASTEKLLLGGLLQAPLTLDQIVQEIPASLPHVIDSLKSKATPELRRFLQTKPSPRALREELCSPGQMLIFFDLSEDADVEELSAIQDAVCRFDEAALVKELERVLEPGAVEGLTEKCRLPGAAEAATEDDFFRVYQKGRELEKELGGMTRRYADQLGQADVDWAEVGRLLADSSPWNDIVGNASSGDLRLSSLLHTLLNTSASGNGLPSVPGALPQLFRALNQDLLRSAVSPGALFGGPVPPRTQIALLQLLSNRSQTEEMSGAQSVRGKLCQQLRLRYQELGWKWEGNCPFKGSNIRRRPTSSIEEFIKNGLENRTRADWSELQDSFRSLESQLRNFSSKGAAWRAEGELQNAAVEGFASSLSDTGHVVSLGRLGLRLADEARPTVELRDASALAASFVDLLRSQLGGGSAKADLADRPLLRQFLSQAVAAADDGARILQGLQTDVHFRKQLVRNVRKILSSKEPCEEQVREATTPLVDFSDVNSMWVWLCNHADGLKDELGSLHQIDRPQGRGRKRGLRNDLDQLAEDLQFIARGDFELQTPPGSQSFDGKDFSRRIQAVLETWSNPEWLKGQAEAEVRSFGASRMLFKYLLNKELIPELTTSGRVHRDTVRMLYDAAAVVNEKLSQLETKLPSYKLGEPVTAEVQSVLWPQSPTVAAWMPKLQAALPYILDSLIHQYSTGGGMQHASTTLSRAMRGIQRGRAGKDEPCDEDLMKIRLPIAPSPFLSEEQKAVLVDAFCFINNNHRAIGEELEREAKFFGFRSRFSYRETYMGDEFPRATRDKLRETVQILLGPDPPRVDWDALLRPSEMPFLQLLRRKDISWEEKLGEVEAKVELPEASSVLVRILQEAKDRILQLDGARISSLADFVPGDYPALKAALANVTSNGDGGRLLALLTLGTVKDRRALERRLSRFRRGSFGANLRREVCEEGLLEDAFEAESPEDIAGARRLVCSVSSAAVEADLERLLDLGALRAAYAPRVGWRRNRYGRYEQTFLDSGAKRLEAASLGSLRDAAASLVEAVQGVEVDVALPQAQKAQWERLADRLSQDDAADDVAANLQRLVLPQRPCRRGRRGRPELCVDSRLAKDLKPAAKAVSHAAQLILDSIREGRLPERDQAQKALKRLRDPLSGRLSPDALRQLFRAETELLDFIEAESRKSNGTWSPRQLLDASLPGRVKELLKYVGDKAGLEGDEIPLLQDSVGLLGNTTLLDNVLFWLSSYSAEQKRVLLADALDPDFSLPDFLTRTFGPVPRFVRAFDLAFIDLEAAKLPESWDAVCAGEWKGKDGSWGGLLTFPPASVNARRLQRAFCRLLSHPAALREIRERLRLPVAAEQLPPLLSDAVEDDERWPELRGDLSRFLQSLEDYALEKPFDAAVEGAPSEAKWRKVHLVRDLQMDVPRFLSWARSHLGISARRLQLWLGTHVDLAKVKHPRNVCQNGRLDRSGLIGIGASASGELEALLCRKYYPTLLDRLVPGFRRVFRQSARRRASPPRKPEGRWGPALDQFRSAAVVAQRRGGDAEAVVAALRESLGPQQDAWAAERLNRFAASLGLEPSATPAQVRAQSSAVRDVLSRVEESLSGGQDRAVVELAVGTALQLLRSATDVARAQQAPLRYDSPADWLLHLVPNESPKAAQVLQYTARNLDRALQPFLAVGLNWDTILAKEVLLVDFGARLRDSVRNATRLSLFQRIQSQISRTRMGVRSAACVGGYGVAGVCSGSGTVDLRSLTNDQLGQVLKAYEGRFGLLPVAPVAEEELRGDLDALARTLQRLGDGSSGYASLRELLHRLPQLSPRGRASLAKSLQETLLHLSSVSHSQPLKLLSTSLGRALVTLGGLSGDAQQRGLTWEGTAEAVWKDFKRTLSADAPALEGEGGGMGPERRAELVAACKASGGSRDLGRLGAVAEGLRGQLNRFPAYKSLACRLNRLDPEALYQTLRDDLGLMDVAKTSTATQTCEEYVSRLEALWGAGSGLVGRLRGPEGTQLTDCLSRVDTDLFATMDRYLELASGVARLAANPEVIDQLIALQPAFQKFIDFIAETAPVLAPVKDLVQGSAEQEFQRLRQAGADPFHIRTYLSAEMDINYLLLRSKATKFAEVVETSLCDPFLLEKLLRTTLQDAVATADLSKGLCMYHSAVSSGLDVGRMEALLPGLRARQPRDEDWLGGVVREGRKLVESATDLRRETQTLMDAVDLQASDLTPERAWDLLRTFQRAKLETVGRAAQRLAESSGRLLGGSEAEAEMERVVRGVLGLRDLQAALDVLTQQPYATKRMREEVHGFLVNTAGLSDAKVSRWADLKIDLSRVVLEASRDGDNSSAVVCSPEELRKIIPGTEASAVNQLSSGLCPVASSLRGFGPNLMRNLDIGALLKRLVERGMEAGLKDSQGKPLSPEDAQKAMRDIRRLPRLMKLIQEPDEPIVSEAKRSEVVLAPDVETAVESEEELGTLLCGAGAVEGLLQQIHLGALTVPTPDELGEADAEEMAELPNQYCVNLYFRLSSTSLGPILWKYLKPWLRGWLLVYPDSRQTRRLMRQANSTWEEMRGWVELLESFGAASESLQSMDGEDVRRLQEALRNPVLGTALKETLEMDGDDLDALLDRPDSKTWLHSRLGKLASTVGRIASCLRLDRVRFYDDKDAWIKDSQRLIGRNSLLAALDFMEIEGPGGELASHVKYTIRMDAGSVPRTHSWFTTLWDPSIDSPLLSNSPYLLGFVQVQDMVESALVGLGGGGDGVEAFVQRLPSACDRHDVFKSHVRHWLGIFAITAALLSVGVLVTSAVTEADSGIRDVLAVSGLRPTVGPLAWALVALAVAIFHAVGVTLVLRYTGVLRLAEPSLVFFVTLSFLVSLIAFCLMVSACFRKTSLAVLTAILVYLMGFIPFLVIHMTTRRDFTVAAQVASCLLAPTAFGYSTLFMAGWEEENIGAAWSNIRQSPWYLDNMDLATTLGMLWVDTLLYLLLAYVLTKIRKRGLRRLLRLGGNSKIAPVAASTGASQDVNDSEGLVARGLWKVYKGKEVPAVRDLNLSLKRGEITALLGHNGAGKSSSIAMMTGLSEPSRGECLVQGRPSSQSQEGALGFCPQANVLFPRLTVKDHLLFYCRLKNPSRWSEAGVEVGRLLAETGLGPLAERQARHLSGGMQRRLCVALAFAGGSKVVVLDEPSAGIDPLARRSIWRLIQARQASSTVLLSTHYLDEADVLADRVAVLHKGRLLSLGTSAQLKDQFGVGYRLKLRFAHPTGPHDRLPSESQVLRFVRESIPRAVIAERRPSGELVLILPTTSGEAIAAVLERLEAEGRRLCIAGIEVGQTTMEEVFMTQCYLADAGRPLRLGAEDKLAVALERERELAEVAASVAVADDLSPSRGSDVFVSQASKGGVPEDSVRLTGVSLKAAQFYALLYKRFCHSWRDWRILLSAVLLPVLFIFLAMAFTRITPDYARENGPNKENEALFLQHENHGRGDNLFFADLSRNQPDPLTAPLNRVFGEGRTLGTACLASSPVEVVEPHCIPSKDVQRNFSVDYVDLSDLALYYDGQLKPCQCSGGRQVCPIGSEGTPPPRRLLNSWDYLYNLSGVSQRYGLEEWLGAAHGKPVYRGYGGWTFRGTGESVEMRTMYDPDALHSLPAYLAGATNVRLRASASVQGPRAVSVATFPISTPGSLALSESLMSKIGDIGISLVFLCAFCFIPAGLVIYPVQERVTKERQVQRLAGVGPLLYWSAALVWDFGLYVVATLVSACVLAGFAVSVFTANANLPACVVLILAFGLALFGLFYLLQRLFADGTTAYLVLFCASVFVGINTVVAVVIMNVFSWILDFGRIAVVLEKVFLIFPQFCLTHGLVAIATNQLKAELYEDLTGTADGSAYKDPLSLDVAGYHLIALLIQAVLFFTLTILADLKAQKLLCSSKRSSPPASGSSDGEPEEVSEERRRVRASQTDALRVLDLRKVYKSPLGQPHAAVSDLSLGLRNGECLALLGVNGAGKTTTFKILTGEAEATEGTVVLAEGLELGYCPQEEASDPFLTAAETLRFVAHLKGYLGSGVGETVRGSLRRFGLTAEADRRVKDLSGGKRRSLQVATSLVGSPELVLLDEPSEGMDPKAKRLLWAALGRLLGAGRSLLLTSHSMEECEALASRLALLSAGRLRALGDQASVKRRYGLGYTLSLELKERRGLEGLERWLGRHWPWAKVGEVQGRRVSVPVPLDAPLPLSALFRALEPLKRKLGLTHYSLSHTTLDEVFVRFAAPPLEPNVLPLRLDPALVSKDSTHPHHPLHFKL